MTEARPNDTVQIVPGDALYEINDELVRRVGKRSCRADAAQLMVPLHEADVPGLLEHLPAGERDILVHSLGAKLDAETYAHLDEAVREYIVETIDNAVLADVVVEFVSDDAVDFMRALHPIGAKFLGG